MKKIIEEIKKNLIIKDLKEEIPIFQKKGFTGLKISKNNFHEITNINNKSSKNICFIDGGNAELIGGNNFSLQIIRVGIVSYKNNNKEWFDKKEFYCLITCNNKQFTAKNLSTEKEINFNFEDELLKEGKSLINISKVGNFIRRLEEIKLALDNIDKTNMIILDGSLEVKFKQEKELMNNLYELADSKNILIAGVCKTNSVITNNGHSVSGILSNINKNNKWFYYPIAIINDEEFKANICFSKLHEKSEYVFKIDLHKGSFEELNYLLTNNSMDPVFLGYPYGLIDVDSIARISNKEVEYLRTKLIVELGKDWEKIKNLLNTTNAHQILDHIS